MTGAARHGSFAAARAVTPDDRVDRGGSAVVLVGTSVLRLSELAVVLLDACAQEWVDRVVLTEALVARFGAPDGDADATTRSILVALADEGLVELR